MADKAGDGLDLEERFFDQDGNPCQLETLCAKEPAWAANRIRVGNAAARELQELRSALEFLDDCNSVAGAGCQGVGGVAQVGSRGPQHKHSIHERPRRVTVQRAVVSLVTPSPTPGASQMTRLKLDVRTLRWCARRMRKHERGMRACQTEAESRQGRAWEKDSAYYMAKAHAYSNAAVVFLLQARSLSKPAKRKARR